MLTAIIFKYLAQKCLIARTGIAMYKRALDLCAHPKSCDCV